MDFDAAARDVDACFANAHLDEVERPLEVARRAQLIRAAVITVYLVFIQNS